MSANNPSITGADIITDVEARLGTPNISSTIYVPWIAYAYLKTYAALANAGQTVKENLFGAYIAVTLTNGTAEYTLSTIIPRFGSVIKLEILFGGTSDQRVRLSPLRSISQWASQANVSTSYRAKEAAVYYLLKDTLGVIPTPPASDPSQATLYAWYIARPYQITATTDPIDIPFRFLYPIVNYVQSKAIEKQNEDYSQASLVEQRFERELEQIAIAASSEYNENDGEGIEVATDSLIFDNPFRT